MQVLYLGRAPRTKETLPYFREKCRVVNGPPGFGASQKDTVDRWQQARSGGTV